MLLRVVALLDSPRRGHAHLFLAQWWSDCCCRTTAVQHVPSQVREVAAQFPAGDRRTATPQKNAVELRALYRKLLLMVEVLRARKHSSPSQRQAKRPRGALRRTVGNEASHHFSRSAVGVCLGIRRAQPGS